MTRFEDLSAFQGKGWRPRKGRMADDVARGRGIWAPWRVDSEYERLEAVLLHCPGEELARVRRPNDVQQLERIDRAAIRREFAAAAAAFRRFGVRVFFLPRAPSGGLWPKKPNLMYVRDLFFATREGAVVSRMASGVRAGEEKHAAHALAALGVPINRAISGAGLFEGADALWLDPRTVVCAVGGRTNAEGFRQLTESLRAQGAETAAVSLPRGVQHLLGLLQIVDARLALLRSELAPPELARLLKRRGFALVPVPETEETTRRQGMNVVTVAPRRILMPDDCPGLRRLYEDAGISVAAALDVRQLRRGAGGLACAVGILSRRA